MVDPLLLSALPAGPLLAAAGQVAVLAGAQWVLNRLAARARLALGAGRAAPRGRRLVRLGLAVYPRLSVWLWACGLYTAAAWHLGPSLAGTAAERFVALAWQERFLGIVTLLCALSLVGRLLYLANRRLRDCAAHDATHWERVLAVVAGEGLQIGLPLGAVFSILPLLELAPEPEAGVRRLVNVFFIGAVGYVLARLVNLAADKVHASHLKLDFSTSVRARTLYTQVSVLRRMALVVVGFVTLASMLMLFAPVRQLGASLLASAGVVGVIAGVAAQRSLANLVAGFQIAVTQPILLEDVVVVEGEYGQIEEITLTYVVVRLWDLRRLVLPISYFLEKPFQNWTRGTPEVVGAVLLSLDYLAPLDALEAEFGRVLEVQGALGRWNGRTKTFAVTEATERGVQVRLTVSADDPDRLWDLRVAVRRALVTFLAREHPEGLPRLRAETRFPNDGRARVEDEDHRPQPRWNAPGNDDAPPPP